jgi:tRNA-2-methylthio-N6-dimethylallyladenosine synthase
MTPPMTGKHADIWVVNTCVVRQSAEDKAYGRLNALNNRQRKDPSRKDHRT